MQTQTLMDLTRAHPKALGQSFVIHRQMKGWTQEEAALRVGVPVEWYRDLEAGDHGVVEKPLIRALANAFDLRYRSLRLAFDRVAKVLKESKMLKKRKDLPEPLILHELGRGIPPEAVLYVSRSFREYVDKHWGMQTAFSPPTPRGCLLDEMFPNVMVDETLPAGRVEFVWREGDAVVRRGFHYIKLSESQAT